MAESSEVNKEYLDDLIDQTVKAQASCRLKNTIHHEEGEGQIVMIPEPENITGSKNELNAYNKTEIIFLNESRKPSNRKVLLTMFTQSEQRNVKQRHIHHNLRLHRTSRCITITSLVLSLIAVVFVANFPKRAHSNDGNFYNIYDELQEKIIEEMTKLLVERHKLKQKKYETKMRFKHTPVSAHISLAASSRIPDPYFKKDYNVCVRIKINSQDHARGVTVDNDGLVILHSGLYYVYASVYFKPNSTEYSSNFAYQTWFQYIYRMRPNSPAHSTVLTRVVHTCCLNCTNSQNTAYSAGVFYLEAGDMLQVCLTGQGLIAFDARSTYLGLFMLTSSSRNQP
ncbi:tumor necrosis factor ligand superfamily member 6 [Biomphalaria pfeifferi]|uniref:Tumor necrosis factor ligand superfamily member 6 n=1 Tax=Biomphalaria pfeifferi TaxID=112525 RepID=A0AAD8BWU6_BIOPF|nr:tumor necrosis factor ligand superfamily member 6 [Biomphalaria pfeifferi]